MKIKSDLLFPAELTPGDEIWDKHEGHDGWAKVVAICSGDQELLVWCDDDSQPLHLPACQRVSARHVVADFMVAEDEADGPDYDATIANWYAGDLHAATAAAAAHRDTCGCDHAVDEVKLAKHLNTLYSGDLSYVLNNS